MKNKRKNIISVFVLSLSLMMNSSVVYASALPDPTTSQAVVYMWEQLASRLGVSLSELSAEEYIPMIIEEVEEVYDLMPYNKQKTVAEVLGRATTTGAKALGYTMNVVNAGATVAVLEYATLSCAQFLLDGIEDLDDDLCLYVCSVICNVDDDIDYYTTKINRMEASALAGLENLLHIKAGEEWAVNSGLASKSTIHDEDFYANMTDSQAEYYEQYLTQYGLLETEYYAFTAGKLYMHIALSYHIPVRADSIYYSYDGTKAYICDGEQLLDGYGNPSTDVGAINGSTISYNTDTGAVSAVTMTGPTGMRTYTVTGLNTTYEYGVHGLKAYRLADGSPAPNTLGTASIVLDGEIMETGTEFTYDETQKVDGLSAVIVPATQTDSDKVATGETAIEDVTESTSSDTGSDGGSTETEMPKLPLVGDGRLPIAESLKGALYFVRDCFSEIWEEMDETGAVSVVSVPLTLGVVAMLIGRGFKRGGS